MKKFFSIFIILFLLSNVYSQTFSGATGTISDDGQPNDFLLNVSNLSSTTLNSSLGIVKVCLNITHDYDADINVFLIAPDGTTINLFSGIGGDGNNFSNTCLSESAINSINTGSPPFFGVFQPQESLGNINNNQNGNGQWKLRIVDTYPQDAGILNSWSVTFGADAAVPIVFTTSNLPIVIINTGGVPIEDDPPIFGTMGIIYNGPGNLNAVTDLPNDYNGNISIEFRGNYSQTLPQKPYKIETLDTSNLETDASLLGMPAESDWVLIANYNDKVFIRNTLAYKLFSEMGHYATRTKFCEVVVNGSYQGVYVLMEKIKRDSNRVNIAKLDPDENTGINLTGGYIIKNDYWATDDSWLLNYHPIDHPSLDVHLVYEYPKPETITTQQKTYIQTFINNYETALYGTNFTSLTTGYRNYIDTNSFIDYFIVNELSRNNDGFKKSCYFHKNKDGQSSIAKLVAGPVWDFDWAWKNINECSIFAATDGSGWAYQINDCGPDVNSPGWYVRLLQDPNFQNELRCRWNNLRLTTLSDTAINSYIDATALYLDEAQQRHFEKWGNLGVNTGTPEIENDVATFAEQITRFKNWITLRLSWLDANIPGDPNSCSLSVQENKNPSLLLYPNPTKSYFSVQWPDQFDETDITVSITDMLGRAIQEIHLQNKNEKINVSTFQKGTYIIQIRCNDKRYINKLLIE